MKTRRRPKGKKPWWSKYVETILKWVLILKRRVLQCSWIHRVGSLRETYFVKPSLRGVYSLFLYLGVVWLKLGLADPWHAAFTAVFFFFLFFFSLPNLRLHVVQNMCIYTHI